MIKNTPAHFNKLISIIIPTLIKGNFRSRSKIYNKSNIYKLEVIIVDNHSTDNTTKIVKSFKSSKITYFKIQNKWNNS